MGGGNEGERGKHCQGTCIKDTWPKPKEVMMEGGIWVCLGLGWTEWRGKNGENST